MVDSSRDRRPRIVWPALLALASTLALAPGCGGVDETRSKAGSGPGKVEDKSPVVVDGSSTVFRISQAASEDFSEKEENIQVVVGSVGTGGGFKRYLDDEIDVVDASRAAKPEEESKAKAQGIPWTRFVVGYDGITVVVNPRNDFVKELSVEQLKRLFEPDSKVATWKDLDPSWPDRKILFFTPDDKSGTFEFFTEATVGKARAQRNEGVQTSPDDNNLVRGVSGSADAIGYFGYAYFKENEATLRAIPIKKSKDAPAVMPSPDTILDKSYSPLARPLFIYVKNKSFRRPGAAAFVKFYLEHVADLAVKAKYVAPTAEDIKANKAALDALAAPAPTS